MTRRIWRACAAFAAVMATSLVLAAPSGAFNGSHDYCGPPNYVYPGYPCYSGEAHTYDYNQAGYLGSGNFQFCEELYYPYVIYSYNCRGTPGSVGGYSDDELHAPFPNDNTFMHDLVVNNDNNRHTLYGYSYW